MTADHERLDALLRSAGAHPEGVSLPLFEAFRGGLLRHIGMEEKLLLPAARKARGGESLAIAARLRIEHSAIASLLVPTPTPMLLRELTELLTHHNLLEEGEHAMYAECDALLAPEVDAILARLRAAPAVPLAPHFDGDGTHRTAREALSAAAQKKPRRR